jgi:hypothetical protein
MMLANGRKDGTGLMRVGWACLLIFNLGQWLAHPAAPLWRDAVDGLDGAALGLSIACLLLGARLNARGRALDGGRSCPSR